MSDGCLLLIARRDDPAVSLLTHAMPHRVVHAAVDDLSRAGWRYESDRPERAIACAGGRAVAATEIAAVLCRIHAIAPAELSHIHRDDREYVASEINGFLYAWLSQFTGVRFNAPTWTSLAGPCWHELQWARVVSQLGIPVATTRGDMDTTAVVVGDDVLGVDDPILVVTALRIARAARAGVLWVTFARAGGWRFHSAGPCPTLDASSAAALAKHVFERADRNLGALCGAA